MGGARERLSRAWRRLKPLAPVAVIAGLLGLLPFTTCLVKLLFHVPCPGCGMTRASLALLRGDLRASLAWHPVAAPAAVGLAVATALALTLPEGDPRWERFVRGSTATLGLALFVAWALRFAGVLPMV